MENTWALYFFYRIFHRQTPVIESTVVKMGASSTSVFGSRESLILKIATAAILCHVQYVLWVCDRWPVFFLDEIYAKDDQLENILIMLMGSDNINGMTMITYITKTPLR